MPGERSEGLRVRVEGKGKEILPSSVFYDETPQNELERSSRRVRNSK